MSGFSFVRALCAAGMICVCAATMYSQATLSLRQPLPGILKPSDVWEFTLVNTSGRPINVLLKAEIDLIGRGPALTLNTGTFILNQGARVVTAAQASSFPNVVTAIPDPAIRSALNTLGQFPAGRYKVTVQLWMLSAVAGGPTLIATDGLEGWVVESTVQPVLLSPSDASENSLPLPVFSWTMPLTAGASPLRTTTTYRLRIVEVIGQQSPIAAIQNNPSWCEVSGIAGFAVLYPASSRAFLSGRRYAWNITAFSNGGPIGTSEVWTFTEGQAQKYAITNTAKPAAKVQVLIDVDSEMMGTCASEVAR